MVVLDSRPFDEYARVSIPTAINVPGAELVLRARDIAPSPDTLVVVNCAGRTRSIIGAQSLINAGAAEQGRGAAQRHHGLEPRRLCLRQRQESPRAGVSRRRRWIGRDRRRNAWRKAAASSASIDATLEAWRSDTERTLYLFDVRDPAEYEAGHVAGAISAPGGQLVQATDQYVGTLGARIVLVDDAEVRAAMTASWLRQMGWQDVFVLAEAGTETGWPRGADAAMPRRCPTPRIDSASLARRCCRGTRRRSSIFR